VKKTVVGVGVIGALLYFLMGGLGLGIGPGEGEAPQTSEAPAETESEVEPEAEPNNEGEAEKPKPPPCELRLDRRGLWRGEATLAIADAVTQCREAGRASVTVTGDAKQGDLDELNRAFAAAGIEVLSNR